VELTVKISWSKLAVAVLTAISWGTAPWRARYRESITGVWEKSLQRGPGAKPRSKDREAKLPWSWSTFGFWRFNGSRKFNFFLKFGNAKKSDNCVIFTKIHRWPRKWEGLEQNWGGAVLRGLGQKLPLLACTVVMLPYNRRVDRRTDASTMAIDAWSTYMLSRIKFRPNFAVG